MSSSIDESTDEEFDAISLLKNQKENAKISSRNYRDKKKLMNTNTANTTKAPNEILININNELNEDEIRTASHYDMNNSVVSSNSIEESVFTESNNKL